MMSIDNDKKLVSVDLSQIIKIWDITSGKCLNTLITRHRGFITSIIPIDNDKKIISASDDGTCGLNASHLNPEESHKGTIKIWDVKSGKCLKTIYNDSGVSSVHVFKQTKS